MGPTSGSSRGSCAAAMPSTWCLERRATLDQTEGYWPELVVTCRAADETDAAPSSSSSAPGAGSASTLPSRCSRTSRRGGLPSVDPGDRLLTAITAFVQMNGNAEQADLVRDGAVVGVETDPGYAGSNPAASSAPGAGSRSLAHDVLELTPRHDELSATQRVGGNPHTVITGQLSMTTQPRNHRSCQLPRLAS